MRKEWNGSLVGKDEFEAKHPQLTPILKVVDPQALRNARPNTDQETTNFAVYTNTGDGIIGQSIESFQITASVGNVTVTGVLADSSSESEESSTTDVTVSPSGVSGTSAVDDVTASGTSAIAATYTVTVVGGNPLNHPYYNVGSSNKFAINGSTATSDVLLSLSEGSTYRFDQSDSSNSGHPLRFSTTANGTHGGGSEYTTGVTTNGTPGSSGAYTQITVASGAPTLYYYCTNHSGMGWQANTP